MFTRRLVILSLALCFWAGAAPAQSPASVATAEDAIETIFSEIEKRIIRDYFEARGLGYKHKKAGTGHKNGRGNGLPPGLAKREQLPPGLAKQLERNGTLPHGLATYKLPADLVAKLPPHHEDSKRIIVGNDVILLKRGTNLILDILKDVLSG